MPDDPKPMHRWLGDALGHNCADCPPSSVWKCDRAAHEQWRERLRDWLAERASQGDRTAAALLDGVDRELTAATPPRTDDARRESARAGMSDEENER